MQTPRDDSDVLEAVADALEAGRSLEIVGGGNQRGYGRPVAAEAVLDLSALAGVVVYEPEELVLTVRPATPLAELRRLLASQGQHLAFEPPDFGPLWGREAGGGTLGGCLGVGLGGPRRPSAGAPRDHFLGARGVNGFGDAFACGGRVVKNVTGYDLPKLLAGSLGTLAVLTEVTVKVLPASALTLTLVLFGLDDRAAIAAMTAALNSSAQVSGAAHLPQAIAARSGLAAIARAGSAATLLRLEGVAPSVAARALHLTELMAGFGAEIAPMEAGSLDLWREVADLGLFTDRPERPLWRLSVPPSTAAAIAARIGAAADCRHLYDWGGGLLWIETPADAHAGLVRAAVAAEAGRDGHATLMRAPAEVRARVAPFQPLDPALALLTARVKDQFDPRRLFNPGRMYEGV